IAAVILRISGFSAGKRAGAGQVGTSTVGGITAATEGVDIRFVRRQFQGKNELRRLLILKSEGPLERIAMAVEVVLPARIALDVGAPEDAQGARRMLLVRVR